MWKTRIYKNKFYWFMIACLSFLFFIAVSGCTTTKELLPNLCYNDKEGTFVCGLICNEDKTVCIDTENPDLDGDRDFNTMDVAIPEYDYPFD